jgi:AcrR family transcriptional regulator
MPVRRPQERRAPQERRKAAMEAALDLLSTLPYEEILVEDIAAAAGMSRPLLYHYFGGKDQVAAAALRWCGDQMLADVLDAASVAGPGWLAAGVHAYVDYVAGRTPWYTALVRHAYLPGTQMESVRKEVRLRISRGLHERLAPNGGSPLLRLLTWGWVGQVETICREWLTRCDPPRDQLEPLLCELLVSALRTGAGLDPRTADALRVLTVGN